MARRSFEDQLAWLEKLPGQPMEVVRAELEKTLAHKSNFLVARAAELAGELEINELFPLLEAAFFRFMEDAVETDKSCRAKTAVVKVLVAADHRAEEIYLAGLSHMQMEPVFGGRQDTAVELRGLCADALVKFHHPDVVELLAPLLADAEKGARAAAARAIGDSGRRDGVALLKYKVIMSDPEPEVLTECFASLLRFADTAEFVGRFLGAPQSHVAESAALAFGEARLDGTERMLIHAAEESLLDRKVAFLALAMMRTRAAIDHLLGVLESARSRSSGSAKAALEALQIYRHDDALMARVAAALARDS